MLHDASLHAKVSSRIMDESVTRSFEVPRLRQSLEKSCVAPSQRQPKV